MRGLLASAAAVATFVAAVSLAPALAAPQQQRGSTATLVSLESAVLADLNQIRVEHGLVPLTLNARLSAAATQHSADMLAKGYFAHDSADGTSFESRLTHYYAPLSYGYWSVGENLIWSTGSLDAARALELWMQSPEHRANILLPRWREIGIAALHATDAPGTYGDRSVTLVATDFGVRHL
jgi:uncharacterized protein YkwD